MSMADVRGPVSKLYEVIIASTPTPLLNVHYRTNRRVTRLAPVAHDPCVSAVRDVPHPPPRGANSTR